ncbi:MAG: ABC transporter permease [Bacilli bacterium]
MRKYVAQRVALILLTTFIILSLTFILMKLLPVDKPIGLIPAQLAFYNKQVALGYMYTLEPTAANELIADIKIIDGGNVSLYSSYSVMQQYFTWLGNIITKFDWGTSTAISLGTSAIDIIARKLPFSMKINVIALVIAVPLGFFFGILAALKKNKMTDHVISTLVMVFISVPSFVIITFLILIFGYSLEWLPTTWESSLAPISQQIKSYIIPVGALCFGTVSGFARYTRAELTEVMSSEFLLLARTKGLTKSQTVVRHAMRNSMVPIVPMIIGEFIGILGGSMILEQLYGIPGIGSLFVTAINLKDYNVVMVDMAIYTMIGLTATLLVDLSYGIVDPRIRMGAKK